MGWLHRRITGTRAGEGRGTAGSPTDVPRERWWCVGTDGSLAGVRRGRGQATTACACVCTPLPLGMPKVDSPSQRRQGTA